MYSPLIEYGGFLSSERILKLVVCPFPCTACLTVGSRVPPKKLNVPNLLVPKVAGVLIVPKV